MTTRSVRLRTMMTIVVASLLVLLLLLWALADIHPQEKELTWLHVEGKYLWNEDDEVVFLRGTGLEDLTWQTRWSGEITQGDLTALTHRVTQLAKLTHGRANAIRVAITPNPKVTFDDDEHYPWNATLIDAESNTWITEIHPEVYDDQVDAIVDLAHSNGIYVIIEFHGGFSSPENRDRYGGNPLGPTSYLSSLALSPRPWIDWNLHWVERYRADPTVVGIELWNEPWDAAFGNGDKDLGRERYLNMVLNCVEEISQANPKVLMILTSAPFGYIHQDFIDLHPSPHNVMYGWHSYYKEWADYWKEEYARGEWEAAHNKTRYKLERDHIGNAVSEGLPLIATEIGWSANTSWEPGWEHQMADYLSILNEWETSWFVWTWWGSPGHMGLAGDFDYSTLSPQGEIWADYL